MILLVLGPVFNTFTFSLEDEDFGILLEALKGEHCFYSTSYLLVIFAFVCWGVIKHSFINFCFYLTVLYCFK